MLGKRNCCCGKAINIIYSKCVSVALGSSMQWAWVMSSSVPCPALQYFSMLPHKQIGFSETCYWIQNVSWFSLQPALQCFSCKKNWTKCCWEMYIYLHVQYPLFLSHWKEPEFSGHIFEKKFWNTKFHENPSIRSRVDPCGRIGRWADMTKLKLPSRSLAKGDETFRHVCDINI